MRTSKTSTLLKRVATVISLLGIGFFVLLVALMFFLPEGPTYVIPKVSIEGGNQPTFKISDGTRMQDMKLHERKILSNDTYESNVIWELQPNNQDDDNIPGEIKYGVVPVGYKQTIPKYNIPPPPLKDEMSYIFQVQPLYNPPGGIVFEFHNGKTTEKPIK